MAGTGQYMLGYNPDGTFAGPAANDTWVNYYWWNQYPIVMKEATTIALHPNEIGWDAEVCWTAPTAGTYLINAVFANDNAWTTSDVNVAVVYGGIPGLGVDPIYPTSLYTAQLHGQGNIGDTVFSTTKTLTLQANDVVLFYVGMGDNGSYYNDLTMLNATVSTVPEPGSLLALLFGVTSTAGLMLRRRR